MHEEGNPFVLNRRGVLRFATGASLTAWLRLYASGSDFWNKKAPADWTSDEIQRLITNSPWARPVTAELRTSDRGGAGGGMGGPRTGGGGLGLPRIGIGRGGPRMGGGRGGGGRAGGASRYKGTVRWESAKPILEAQKTTLSDSFAGHYVINVSGFPMPTGRGRRSQGEGEDYPSQPPQNRLDHLKTFTSLQPKGKALVQAGIVQQPQDNAGAGLLFGFSKEILALGRGDKEVTFSTRLGRLAVKAKFNLAEMMYHGELAL